MADEKKKISLGGIDDAAEGKGSFWKTLWQLVKFLVVSGLVTIIQLVLAYLLPFIFDHVQATLPVFLQGIFNPNFIFEAGSDDYTKYVHDGITTWGYVLPFLLSNLIANIYGYIQNKKTTFKSDAPKYCFVIYIVLMLALILFSTWMQGAIYGALSKVDNSFISGVSRLIASMAAGFVQMVVLFPMEKFVLLKEKKKDDESAEEIEEETEEMEEMEETEEETAEEETAE
jgi:putative flippase GtrA